MPKDLETDLGTDNASASPSPSCETGQPAIIYCRVSSKGQTGLGSQEHRCRQYAAAKGYNVVSVFHDDVTGGGDFMNRPGMVALLRFMDAQPQENFVVIFDDLKRYARDVEFHLHLRRIMLERGAVRECLNFSFEDSPEGKFNEIINAAVGELDRQQTARQNNQKSIARLEQGYAVISQLPIGYKYVKVKGGNSEVVKDEPYASIVQEALEGYASGRFSSQAELVRFLEAQPDFPKHTPKGKIRQCRIASMLRQVMYAGYVKSDALGVSIRDGKHQGLVSKAVFERIQERLKQAAYAPARKDIGKDFVLRGAVACGHCSKPLRSSWSTGEYQKFAYYLCQSKGCKAYGKSIPRDKIEGEIGPLLAALQPSENLFRVVIAMFRKYWDMNVERTISSAKSLKDDIRKTEAQIEKLVERTLEATNVRVITAYEKRIDALEMKKLVLSEKASKAARPPRPLEEILELSLKFLSNPYGIWASGKFTLKRMVLKLAFSEPLLYCKNTGYRTPKTSLPFSILDGKNTEISACLKDGAAGEN